MANIPSGFDYFGFHEIPTFVLCNPNKTPLYSLAGITDRNLQLNFNSLSTLTFMAYPEVDGVKMDYYDYIQSKRLVLIDDVGYFIITSVEEKDNGIEKYKTVTANSLEAELIFKKVNLISGTYKFHDINKEEGLLGKILANIPSWTIGEVDIDLINKYRTFDITDTSVYNFLTTTVSETFECVFKFDSFNKTVSAYAVENVIKPTSIYLSHDNLILETNIRELTDELYTAMQVTGGNDLSIFTVNPLGGNYIYNFDYYLNAEENNQWMTQGLKDAIVDWKTKVESKTILHKSLVLSYYNNQILLYGDGLSQTGLYGAIDTKRQELMTLEATQSRLIYEKASLTSINSQIASKKNEISQLQDEINDVLSTISDIVDELETISNDLSLNNESNFTLEQQKELSSFIIETSYQNEHFIQTDSMNPAQIQEQAQELYDQSIKVLDRISQPRFEFTIDSLNLIFLKEFAEFSKQLELGCEVFTELSNGSVHRPVLLQIQLNYDDPSSFSMTFGNRLRLDSSEFIFADLFGNAISTSNSVSLNSGKWNNFNANYKDRVNNFITSNLDASKNAIVSSSDQEFIIDSVGLRGRRLTASGYDDKQLWINNSIIAFTDDNWNSARLALGEFIDNDSEISGYGLIADAIVGKLIAGNQLLISNENSSFLVDANGVTVTDSNFIIRHTEGGESTTKSLVDVLFEINTNIDNVTDEVASKMVTTFYQDILPIDAKKGDLWHNTSDEDIIDGDNIYESNRLYRYNENNEWDIIEDAKIIEAINLANNAQYTADGKIVTYYANEISPENLFPNLEDVVYGVGDLWINTTDNRNELYRFDGDIWILIKDKDLINATTNIANLTNLIGSAFKSSGIIDASKLDGIIDTVNTAMKSTTSNVIFDDTGVWFMDTDDKNTSQHAIKMNGVGILLGNRTTTGEWLSTDFQTAITPQGISADCITTGTLNAINIKGGSIFIGGAGTPENCNFGVTTSGKIIGIETETEGFSYKNGIFNIDGSLVVDGSITLNGNIAWSASNSPVQVQYSVDGLTNWHTLFQSGDFFAKYSYDGGSTWTTAHKIVAVDGVDGRDGRDGSDGSDANVNFTNVNNVLKNYFGMSANGGTVLGQTEIFSPKIYAGEIYAGEGKGQFSRMSETGLNVYRNSTTPTIGMGWDSNTQPYITLGIGTDGSQTNQGLIKKFSSGIWIGDSDSKNSSSYYGTGIFIDFVNDKIIFSGDPQTTAVAVFA